MVQEFIGDRLAEQKASLASGAAALKTECEEIMSDIRSARCGQLSTLPVDFAVSIDQSMKCFIPTVFLCTWQP
jgi:hypothetical protein